MRVEYVPNDFVVNCWDSVANYLQKGIEKTTGEYNLHHLKAFVVSGMQSLYVTVDDNNEIKGAATVSFINYPNHRVAFVTCAGGKMMASNEVWNEFAQLLKSVGVTKCQGYAQDSLVRLWESKMGFKKVYSVIEKNI